MKRLSVIFATLASILLILIVIFSMLQVTMNSETFINNEFTKLGTAKDMDMNNADLVRATMQLIRYMEGSVDSIDIDVTIGGQKVPMFELEQEHTHMEDVRLLYQGFRTGRDVGILVMLILFLIAALMGFRRAGRTFATGYLSGLFACALVFGFVGMWALLDFSGFWTFFHQMLFWNEEWLFDPTESRMINMLPEQLFADIIGRMAVLSLIVIGIIALISIFTLISAAAKRRKARARAEERRLAIIEHRRKQQEAAEAAARGEVVEPPEQEQQAPQEPPAPEPEAEKTQKKRKRRRETVGDEIPVKPKEGDAPKRGRKEKPKQKAAPTEKAKATEETEPKAQKAAPPEKKRKAKKADDTPKRKPKAKPAKLRRGDAPFELNLDIDPNAADEDDDDLL